MPTADPRDLGAAERMADRQRAYRESMVDLDAPSTEHLTVEGRAGCTFCDDAGYRPNGRVCDHRDRSDVGRPQRAEIDRILTKGKR